MVPEFSTRLFNNADVLKRYLRNNCIAAGLLFPLIGGGTLLGIRLTSDISAWLGFDLYFWGFLFSVFGFYAASRHAFPENHPSAAFVSVLSMLVWVIFTVLIGLAAACVRLALLH